MLADRLPLVHRRSACPGKRIRLRTAFSPRRPGRHCGRNTTTRVLPARFRPERLDGLGRRDAPLLLSQPRTIQHTSRGDARHRQMTHVGERSLPCGSVGQDGGEAKIASGWPPGFGTLPGRSLNPGGSVNAHSAQASVSQRLAADEQTRWRSVPPSSSTSTSQSVRQRWHERPPRCPALRVTQTSRRGRSRYRRSCRMSLSARTSCNHMTNTDSTHLEDFTPAISLRENERGMHTGAGWNPHWHQPTDVFTTFSDEDFHLGLNAAQTNLGAIAKLSNASVSTMSSSK